MGNSYNYLLQIGTEHEAITPTQNGTQKLNIATFGYTPWLKTVLYDKFNVYEVLPADWGEELSIKDKKINSEFLEILQNPASKNSSCIINKYDINYIYTSDKLADRFYSPYQLFVFYPFLDVFSQFTFSPFIYLIKTFEGNDEEHFNIYAIDRNLTKDIC
jgi:hypothetical protein